MKKSALILFFAVLASGLFAQTKPDPQNIQVKTTRDPEYPKGEKALYQEVLMNVKYSPEAVKKYVEGAVELSFDVKTDSTVINCIVLKGVEASVDEAVKNYVTKLKFSPGMMNGMKVKMNMDMVFPVKAH